MNTKSLLLVAVIASATVSTTALAYSPKDNTKPAPRVIESTVVQPSGLPRTFIDSVVNVEFTLDAAGKPHDVKVLSVSDSTIQRQVAAAFRQWRFDVSASGAAVTPKRFILPIEIRAEG